MHGCNCHFPKLRPLWFPHQPPSTLDALTPCCRHWLCGEPVQGREAACFFFCLCSRPSRCFSQNSEARPTWVQTDFSFLHLGTSSGGGRPVSSRLSIFRSLVTVHRAGRAAFLRAHLRRAFSSAFKSVVACGCLFPELKKLMDTLWYVGLC